MRLEDLQLVFRSSTSAPTEAQAYVVNLLNKFEVALTWDSRTLLIPSLLPTEDQTAYGLPGSDVRVKVKLLAKLNEIIFSQLNKVAFFIILIDSGSIKGKSIATEEGS
jgi:hypothetical protein